MNKKNLTVDTQELLYGEAITIIESARKRVVASIYKETTKSYYLLGRLIVEDEQKGEDKAQYGKSIIKSLSQRLMLKYGKGFSVSTLKDCRKFYQKLQLLTKKLECTKSQSVTGELNFKLSFTHYTYLMRLDDEEMSFYENYAIHQQLSVRGLQRAVKSNMMLRAKKEQKSLAVSIVKPNPKNNEQIFASKYKLYLPSKKELVDELFS